MIKIIKEGRMKELHASIGEHMDKHIGEYRQHGGAEALMGKVNSAAKSISKLHNISHEAARKHINDYVQSKLEESTNDQTGENMSNLQEGIRDDIQDRLAELRRKRKEEGKADDKPSGPRKIAGRSYGGSAQEDEDEEGKPKPQQEKRKRGRPRKDKFSEMIDLYNENGLKALNEMVIFEEPDNEQYTKELNRQKRKASGTSEEDEKAQVAKGSVQAVRNEEVEELDERELSSTEMNKREEVVKSMKKKLPEFRKRYGERAKEVMYATATKVAKKD